MVLPLVYLTTFAHNLFWNVLSLYITKGTLFFLFFSFLKLVIFSCTLELTICFCVKLIIRSSCSRFRNWYNVKFIFFLGAQIICIKFIVYSSCSSLGFTTMLSSFSFSIIQAIYIKFVICLSCSRFRVCCNVKFIFSSCCSSYLWWIHCNY
jgi:hypothetical protein